MVNKMAEARPEPKKLVLPENLPPHKKLVFPKKLVLIIASEKGGVRKTTLGTALLTTLALAGLNVRAVQVDRQERLGVMSNLPVTTIEMPGAEEIRRDDLADATALAPLLDMVLDPANEVVVIDIGSNLDARFAEFWAAQDLDEELRQAEVAIIAFVPLLPEADALTLAGRTAERLTAVLPDSARIVFVEGQTGASYANLSGAAGTFVDKVLQPARDRGDAIKHPLLYPRTMSILERARLNPAQFRERPVSELVELTGEPTAVVRQVRADVSTYLHELGQELAKIFPFRNGSAVG
ncbi:hypothetical protein ABEG18_06325 [Alsobacter sp. KACC 23698]|uniref:CobQ/CobB/MinD/ParA nucleotide binding domain-containing protein n=1 Tax=Alsobacter sp. KACC 23698 TaxID=3149229 RepID=A0AAU7JJR0_9HYPH